MALVPIKPSQVSLAYNSGADVDIDNDVLVVGSNASSGQVAKLSPAQLRDAIIPVAGQRYWNVDPGPGFGDEYSYTDDAVLTAAQDGAAINNAGAAKAIEITLPAAVAGMTFEVDRVALFSITMKPNGTDTIALGNPGVSYVLNTDGLTVFSCYADTAWRVSIGGWRQYFLDIRDFGASASNTAAQNTPAIQNAINAVSQYYGGAVFVPAGGFKHNELATPPTWTGGLRIYGENKFASRLIFEPTGDNQTGITVNRTSGGAVSSDIYSGFVIQDVGLATTDTTYNKTGLKLVDCGESTIKNVNIFGYTGTAKDCVGLETQGRESLWIDGLHITACVPIRIGVNPDLTSGWLSADHFTFRNLYLSVIGTPDALTSACILVDPGVHASNLQFDGSQAWVGGDYGLYWNQSAATYAYCSSVSLKNVRTEGGTSATAYSVYLNMATAQPLYNLTLENCEFDVAREGVYTNEVYDQVWTSVFVKQPSPRTIMNVSNARSITWHGVTSLNTASTSAVVTDSKLYLTKAEPQRQGQIWPSRASWSSRATASTYNERPSREMSAHKWYWSGTLADGVSNGATGDGSVTLIPCNSDINSWVHAEVKVIATIAGSNILEYGTWYISPITGLTNGVVKASGSTNTVSTDTDTNLCVFCNGASPMYQQMVVRNRLGASAVVTIEVTGKRSVET